MKKIFFSLGICLLLGLVTSCSPDESPVYTYEIENLRAEPQEGGIKLNWELPEDQNLMYIKVEYYNIREKKNYVVNKSIFANSLEVNGLLARDGEYTFRFTAVDIEGNVSSSYSEISCRCLPVKPVVTTTSKDIDAEIVHYETNAQEPSEGPLEHLFDGDNGTFFHTPWSIPSPGWPQWVEIEVSQPVNGAIFYTINRDNGSGRPGYVEILASNDRSSWVKLYEFSGTNDIPETNQGRYESPLIYDLETTYKYFRYSATEGNMGNAFWNMAEMGWSFYEVSQSIYDPENELD